MRERERDDRFEPWVNRGYQLVLAPEDLDQALRASRHDSSTPRFAPLLFRMSSLGIYEFLIQLMHSHLKFKDLFLNFVTSITMYPMSWVGLVKGIGVGRGR